MLRGIYPSPGNGGSTESDENQIAEMLGLGKKKEEEEETSESTEDNKDTEDSKSSSEEDSQKESTEESTDSIDPILAELNALMGFKNPEKEEKSSEEETETTAAQEQTSEVEEPQKEPVFNFDIDDDTYNDLFEKKEKFVSFLNNFAEKVYSKAQQDARNASLQETYNLLSQKVYDTVTKYSAAQNFWRANQDLRPIKQIVIQKANQIQSENPDWDIEKVFLETGKEVRRIISKLKGTENENSKQEVSFAPPPVPTKKGGEKKKLTKEQQEILDLIS